MHGINLSMIKDLEREAIVTTVMHTSPNAAPPTRPARTPGVTPIAGLRNLFGLHLPSQMFTAHDRMQNPYEVPPSVRELTRRLAQRMRLGHAWTDTLAGATHPDDNPNLPSGYTYLLQLIAHDLVDSTISLARTNGARFGFVNARQLPLSLETIYGGGPDTCPRAYEFGPAHHVSRGAVPRTRLRTGRLQNEGVTGGCPFHDIGRARPADASDGATFASPLPQAGSTQTLAPPLTEALVADPRNDSHAMLSQLTTLFHLFHNQVETLTNAAQNRSGNAAASLRPDVQAYLRFAATRIAVTLIYRRIIVNDVLRRILHPQVLAWYSSRDNAPVDNGKGIPLEFSHGAFRFGHAMVRDEYRVNSDIPRNMNAALTLSTQRTPGFLPVTETWHVDWARFFPVGGTPVNLSRRIAPFYAGTLDQDLHFKPLDDTLDTRGLASRDLVSACFAGFWSVPMLISELRRGQFAHLLTPYNEWHEPIRAWLKARSGQYVENLEETDIDDIVADPPLPFFVLLEAALAGDTIAPSATDGGRNLGPLGSIIVAETIFGALRDHPISFEDAGPTLAARLRRVGQEMTGDAGTFAPLAGIEAMPELIAYIMSSGALGTAAPG
jgi:hypothetical protein